MTIAQKPVEVMSIDAREALIDKLRARSTTEEILSFEAWFNSNSNKGPLHLIICDFLRNRSISRVLAAKWLAVLINDREYKLKN